ncbi:MAG TPA: glycosyltransferase [Bryobacteraceae bacterium]|nr:glycosyltransferase [Bryobacteraceae bacterium]
MTRPLRSVLETTLGFHRHLLRFLYLSPLFRWTGKPLAKCTYLYRLPAAAWLLPQNPLFVGDFYASSNQDLDATRNLWAHYIAFGAGQARDPHPLFSTDFYLRENADVRARGLNPLLHYVEFGAAENRRPHPAFDPIYYFTQRPGLQQTGANPLLHYWFHGRHEGVAAVQPPATVTKLLHPATQPARKSCERSIEAPRPQPVFSILLPTFNTPPDLLRTAIASVTRQSYPHWQLCIFDDGSSNRETLAIVKRYVDSRDSRIRTELGTLNSGTASATNAALARARGDYIAMLDHHDELDPQALEEVAALLQEDPSLDVVYTDQDYVDVHERQTETLLKPDWSPEMFRGVMFVNQLLVVRTELARAAGGFDSAFDRIQDFEFMLRVSEKTTRIGHVPRILYRRRSAPGSLADGAPNEVSLEPLQAAAVNAHLARCGIQAVASPDPALTHRLILRPAKRFTFPRVLIAIRNPERDSIGPTLRSILQHSTYPNFTVCLPQGSFEQLPEDPRIQSGDLDAIHQEIADEEFLVWIDSGLEVVTAAWIETLLMYAEQPDVACVSPLMVREGRVHCSGLVLGMNDSVGYVMRGLPSDSEGYAGSLACAREVSAVSGECMMIRGAVLRSLGPNVRYYSTSAFAGADLSVRGLSRKKRNIVTPQAIVQVQRGALSSGSKLDEQLFADRWRDLIDQGDPYYNPNFLLAPPGYQLRSAIAGAVA